MQKKTEKSLLQSFVQQLVLFVIGWGATMLVGLWAISMYHAHMATTHALLFVLTSSIAVALGSVTGLRAVDLASTIISYVPVVGDVVKRTRVIVLDEQKPKDDERAA